MAEVIIYAYKIDNNKWQKWLNVKIKKSELEALRQSIIKLFYPKAKQCLFIYEEKG